MKILICGLGSIGKRHARLIQQGFPGHQLVALRTGKGQEKNDLGIPELATWEEVDRQTFDVAFITNPTFLHVQYATQCARRRMHVFIEKPIDCSTAGLDDLLELVRGHQLTAYVAYPLRFHPVVQALRPLLAGEMFLHSRSLCASYLPLWRPGQDHRKSYSGRRDQGGGVMLDLSHDIDLIHWLFGGVERIAGTLARRGDVTEDAEDTADLQITHAVGQSVLHLNYVSRLTQRWIEIDTTRRYFRADLIQNSLQCVSDGETWTRTFPCERDDIYRAQLRYFFDNLADSRLMNNLAEASQLFRKILACREQT